MTKRFFLINLFMFFSSIILCGIGHTEPTVIGRNEIKIAAIERVSKLRLPFIANEGQVRDENVNFYVKTFGGAVYVTKQGELIYLMSVPEDKLLEKKHHKYLDNNSIKSKTFSEVIVNARSTLVPRGENKELRKVNYFIGNEKSKWKTDIETYNTVNLGEIYNGIELKLKAKGKTVEKIFIINPGADAKNIEIKIEGINSLKLNDNGDIETDLGFGSIRLTKPIAYQERNGRKDYLQVAYHLDGNTYGFRVSDYDRSKPLIIDPILAYSTYLGGSNYDRGNAIAVDSFGNAYIVGMTGSIDFPTVLPMQENKKGQYDVFIAKIDPSGDMLYSTYLGGSGYYNHGLGIAVDSNGDVYITGQTNSTDFPTVNPIQSTYGGGNQDAFVTKIDSSGGDIIYSTYLGGNGYDSGEAIAIDGAGNTYITGLTGSTDFPTVAPIQGTYGGGDWDAFVTKIDSSGNALVYSTYLGGSSGDNGAGIAVDTFGNVYVVGSTSSTNFPTALPIQSAYGGGESDAFVTKINSSGNNFIYSTYLGGSDRDYGSAIAIDTFENAHITGSTSSINFPTASPIQGSNGGGDKDAFVTKVNVSGNAYVYSTYLGGSDDEQGLDIAVDTSGNAYVAGNTKSSNFPTASPIQGYRAGPFYDAFITKISPSGDILIYSTYLGGYDWDIAIGIAVDNAGNSYITGYTTSNDFPLSLPFQEENAGFEDAFIVKISEQPGAYTFTTDPPGLQITIDGSTYTTPKTFNWNPGSSHTISVPSPQSGALGIRYIYSSWSDKGAQTHTIIIPHYNIEYTAYLDTQYSLTTFVNPPGRGTATPSGTAWYNIGQNVPISATANPGYTFSGWSGDITGTANPTFININVPKNVTANFTTSIIESISPPNTPSGRTNGYTGISYTYSTGGSLSNLDHLTEYRFDWGDGTFSNWSSSGSGSKSWLSTGTYMVNAQARCSTDTSVLSSWSLSISVTIEERFAQPWVGQDSFNIKFTDNFKDGSGNTRFQSDTETFAGTIELYSVQGNLIANEKGCYISFLSNDAKISICIKDIARISTEYVKMTRTDSFYLIGTGDFAMSLDGEVLAGISYLDVSKGTLKKDKFGEVISINISGKIAGGYNDTFIFRGTFGAVLIK